MNLKRQFRILNVADLSLILKMNESFRSGFANKENARQFLQNPMNWFFACIQDGRIIGFAILHELNRLDNSNMMYVKEIGVLPEYKRQGIAYKMLSDIKELCRISGICKLFLMTQKANLPACALYEKAGGQKLVDYDNGDVDIAYIFNNFN